MAVSTRALSGFDSVTYRLVAGLVATRAGRADPIMERRPRRPAVLITFDERLAMVALLWLSVLERKENEEAKLRRCDFINLHGALAKFV